MRVLILSTTTGYQLRSFGEAADRLGVELVFATDRCHTLEDPWQDAAVPVRFHDEAGSLAAIVGAASERPIHGVLAVGDRPVVLAARAAAALGLPGNPPEAAAASADKRLARRCFERAGLAVPWYFAIPTTADSRDAALPARYPAVVKPIGLSGSRGVMRVDSPEQFVEALQRLYALLSRKEIREMRTGLDAEILIEGYIEGREYAVEGVLTAGRFQPFAIFDKPDPLDGPYFEETIYVTPSALSLEDEAAILETVERAARALGLVHGPVHAECRVGSAGPYILEVAPRPIGGLCSRVLRFCEKGAAPFSQKGDRSLEEVLLRHALGEDVGGFRREADAAAVMMIPIPRRGRLKGVKGEDAARTVPYVEDVRITAKNDQLLEPLPEAGSYLGFIFTRAPDPRTAERAVRDAHARLEFAIDTEIRVS
jgi:hypothetical protein